MVLPAVKGSHAGIASQEVTFQTNLGIETRVSLLANKRSSHSPKFLKFCSSLVLINLLLLSFVQQVQTFGSTTLT